VTGVTLVPSGSVADVFLMVVALDLLDGPGFGMSPELVLVDAALAAEVRHLLPMPEDTLERLERDGDRRRLASQEVTPRPQPDDHGVPEHEHSESSDDDFEPSERGLHFTSSESKALQPEGSAPELAEAIRQKAVSVADQVIKPIDSDVSSPSQQASNTYPELPSPPPEYSQEDATGAVLRLITRSS